MYDALWQTDITTEKEPFGVGESTISIPSLKIARFVYQRLVAPKSHSYNTYEIRYDNNSTPNGDVI